MSDYPSEADLEKIRAWEGDVREWFAIIQQAGNYWPDWGWHEEDVVDESGRPVHRFHVSTGGWSGNEEILSTMSENFIMWATSWQEHRRGGHYVFEIVRAPQTRGSPP